MRKLAGILILSLGLSLVPAAANAVTYEDSFADCSYPKTFDLVVMRPLSFGAMLVGAVLYVPMSLIALATVHHEMGTVGRNLVGAPASFTFNRPLGECTGVDLSY